VFPELAAVLNAMSSAIHALAQGSTSPAVTTALRRLDKARTELAQTAGTNP
jgi:hypothetical protein